jgi:uncharacterized membrane protein YjgN (DUF898 family)
MSEPRKSRSFLILVLGILVVAGIAVAASVIAEQVQTNTARASYNSADIRVVKQIEVDDNAHAALTTVQTSGFAANASKAVTSLTSCMGKLKRPGFDAASF